MNFVFVALSFVLVAFGQPAWVRGFGVLAAGFGFALFWKAMLSLPRPRDRFLLSVVWFAAVQGVQLSWMATTDYMGPLILIVYAFLLIAMGIQFGLLSLFFKEPMSWRQKGAMAGFWVLCEWIRLFPLCGFTWNPVGLALTDSPFSLQFAAIWGIFGLSFWVILTNLAALKTLFDPSKRNLVAWASLAFLPYAFGWIHQMWIETYVPVSKTFRVALVQTGLLPNQKDPWSNAPGAFIPPIVQWERILLALDEKKKVDLIVLPEAALPFGAHRAGYDLAMAKELFDEGALPPLKDPYAVFYRDEWKVSNAFLLQALANQSGAHVIAGLDDIDPVGSYNAAFHFHPNNLPYERYEKQVLVPIAEYIPLQEWQFLSQFVAEEFGISSSFTQGSGPKIFKAQIPIGISICVEETFSHLMREMRMKGAELFVNLTNDGWFPGSKLPRQHLDHGRIRAAENGIPILRSCNTGMTAGIDCFGRPFDLLSTVETEAQVLYLSLPIRSYSTLYTWWGNAAILGLSLTALLFNLLPSRKKLLP